MNPKTLIIGIGNTLMTDDGVGPAVISLLEKNLDLDAELLTLDTPGFSLLTYIQDREKVIIVDAASFDAGAGAIARVTRNDIERKNHSGLSLHDADPFAVVDYAEKLGLAPKEMIVYAVRFEKTGPGMGLTPKVKEAAEKVAEAIINEIGK